MNIVDIDNGISASVAISLSSVTTQGRACPIFGYGEDGAGPLSIEPRRMGRTARTRLLSCPH